MSYSFLTTVQVRRTKLTVPGSKMASHAIDTLDLGNYAHVGLMATDDSGMPAAGSRDLTVRNIAGDHTATVHVEPLMWLNIEFNSSAVLSFHVTLYEVSIIMTPAGQLIALFGWM